MAGKDRGESVLALLAPSPAQGKLQSVRTVEQLPESIFNMEWHNGQPSSSIRSLGALVLLSVNSLIVVTDTQVYVLAVNPYGATELKSPHKVAKDCSPLSIILANSAHCFAASSHDLHVLTATGQLYLLGYIIGIDWSFR